MNIIEYKEFEVDVWICIETDTRRNINNYTNGFFLASLNFLYQSNFSNKIQISREFMWLYLHKIGIKFHWAILTRQYLIHCHQSHINRSIATEWTEQTQVLKRSNTHLTDVYCLTRCHLCEKFHRSNWY